MFAAIAVVNDRIIIALDFEPALNWTLNVNMLLKMLYAANITYLDIVKGSLTCN